MMVTDFTTAPQVTLNANVPDPPSMVLVTRAVPESRVFTNATVFPLAAVVKACEAPLDWPGPLTDVNDHPVGGADSGVTYIVFKGTKVANPHSNISIDNAGNAAAARFLDSN